MTQAMPHSGNTKGALRVIVRPLPKIVFFYLTWILSAVFGLWPATPDSTIGLIWMGAFFFNTLVISFDFNEERSLIMVLGGAGHSARPSLLRGTRVGESLVYRTLTNNGSHLLLDDVRRVQRRILLCLAQHTLQLLGIPPERSRSPLRHLPQDEALQHRRHALGQNHSRHAGATLDGHWNDHPHHTARTASDHSESRATHRLH